MMKKIFYSSLVLVALAFSLFGCGQAKTKELTQSQNGITAVFSMSPASPSMMEPVTLLFSLTDANGKVIEGAQVAYDLTMPGMAMPPNQPQATDEGSGHYNADAIFTMSGDWRAEATVTYNGETTIFAFDFSIN